MATLGTAFPTAFSQNRHGYQFWEVKANVMII